METSSLHINEKSCLIGFIVPVAPKPQSNPLTSILSQILSKTTQVPTTQMTTSNSGIISQQQIQSQPQALTTDILSKFTPSELAAALKMKQVQQKNQQRHS